MRTTTSGPPVPAPSPSSPPAGPPQRPGTAALVAATAAAAAGLVHAAAAGSHSGDTTLMWLFSLTAAAQLAWAGWMVLQPGRTAAVVGIALNGGAALAWVASRTVGLIGPLREVEAVGTQDLLAALLGALAAGTALVALRTADRARPARTVVVAFASALVLLLAVPAMAAEHSHGGSHDHGHGEAATAHEHSDGDDHPDGVAHTEGHDHTTDAASASGPIVSLADVRLTRRQRRDATALLETSRAALRAFPDEAAVIAAGYQSIGDGRAVGRFEHFVNRAYLGDGRELDPGAIESIVMQKQADGTKTVMSAMYILEPGSTMADVPDIAGELTTWHDHQNLCWDETGTRLAGVLRDGSACPAAPSAPPRRCSTCGWTIRRAGRSPASRATAAAPASTATTRRRGDHVYRAWQCFALRPLPQGHGSLREAFRRIPITSSA